MSDDNGLAVLEDNGLAVTGLEDVGGSFERLPVVSFRGSKTKKPRLSRLEDAGIEEGSFYVQDDVAVTPTRFLFVTPSNLHVYGKMDEEGKVESVRAKTQGGWRPNYTNPADKGWSDLLVSIVLAPIGDSGLTAAKLQLFKAATNIFERVGAAQKQAANPAVWAGRGGAFAESAKATHWFGRFVVAVTVKDQMAQNGRTFANGVGVILPTPTAFVTLFNDYVKSGALTAAQEVFVKIRAKLLEKES